MTKTIRRLLVLLMSAMLFTSMFAVSAFAATSSEEEEDDDDDYAIYDPYIDVQPESVIVYWEVGESKCSYKVEVFKSSNLKASNKVGNAMTVSYGSAKANITPRVISAGSHTYYVRITAKKHAKGEDAAQVVVSETITSEEVSLLKKNYTGDRSFNSTDSLGSAAKNVGAQETSGPGISGTSTDAASAGTDTAGTASGATDSAGTAAAGTDSAGTASAGASAEGAWGRDDMGWFYTLSDGSKAAGWFPVNGVWYFAQENGYLLLSSWIPSQTEADVWYYVDENGAMLVNTTTPDGYTVDADGRWHA